MYKNMMSESGAFSLFKGHYLQESIIDSLRNVINEEFTKFEFEDEDAADYHYENAEIFLKDLPRVIEENLTQEKAAELQKTLTEASGSARIVQMQ